MFVRGQNSGGGGGSGIKGDNITLTASQTTTIETGLDSVKKFGIVKHAILGGDLYHAVSTYDADASTAKYTQSGYNGTASFGGNANINATADASRCVKINSISGGNVSITAPSSNAYAGNMIWYAE